MGHSYKPENFNCGRVMGEKVHPGGRVEVFTCGERARWVPLVHIRFPGSDKEAVVGMGSHSLCHSCRLTFKLDWLKKFSMWHSILNQVKAEGLEPPKDAHLDVQFVAVEDFIRESEI